MNPELAKLTRRTLTNLSALSSVTNDWTRVLPEEQEAIQRVGVVVGELNWDARRLT